MPPLQSAISHLGLNEAQAVALIDNLFLERAFEPQHLWNSVHLIGGNFGRDNTVPDKLFEHIYGVMCKARAYNSTNNFNPEYVFKHLFADEHLADTQDAEDLLLYWSQSSYGIRPNGERHELPEQKNLRANQQCYLKNASTLGLIESIYSDRCAYDETWIFGAPRQALLDRLETAKSSIDGGVLPGRIKVLTGGWELHTRVSGLYNPISGKLEGGEDYLVELAKKNALKVDESHPFIVHQSSPNDRSGRTHGRTYLNLASHESRKPTETMMANDLLQQVFVDQDRKISIAETLSDVGSRPQTLMQVQQEAKRLAAHIKQMEVEHPEELKEYHIQLVSGQPSVNRVAVLTQRTINAILQQEGVKNVSVTVHGIGVDANVRIESLQSDVAAYIHQLYLTATEHQSCKRPAKSLEFQTRTNSLEAIPVLPDSYNKKSWAMHTMNSQNKNDTVNRS